VPGTCLDAPIDALLHAERAWSNALLGAPPRAPSAPLSDLPSDLERALGGCPPRLARRLRARYSAPRPALPLTALRAHLDGREQAWARALGDLRGALAPPAATHDALDRPHPDGLLEALRASGVGLRGLSGAGGGAWALSEARALAWLEEAALGVDESYEEALRRGRPLDLSGDGRPAGEAGRGLERLAWALLSCPWPLLGAYAAARDPSGHAADLFAALSARGAPPALSAAPAPLPRDLFGGADLSVRRAAGEGGLTSARGWLQVSLAGEGARGAGKASAARALGCFWALTPHALAARCPPEHPAWRGAGHTPTTREGRAYALRQRLVSAAARPARHPLGAAGQVPLALAWEIQRAVGELIGRPATPRAPSRGRSG